MVLDDAIEHFDRAIAEAGNAYADIAADYLTVLDDDVKHASALDPYTRIVEHTVLHRDIGMIRDLFLRRANL